MGVIYTQVEKESRKYPAESFVNAQGTYANTHSVSLA